MLAAVVLHLAHCDGRHAPRPFLIVQVQGVLVDESQELFRGGVFLYRLVPVRCRVDEKDVFVVGEVFRVDVVDLVFEFIPVVKLDRQPARRAAFPAEISRQGLPLRDNALFVPPDEFRFR